MKIEEALKQWLIHNQREFAEEWQSSRWYNSDLGTWCGATYHLELDMAKLLEQIDLFTEQFNKTKEK